MKYLLSVLLCGLWASLSAQAPGLKTEHHLHGQTQIDLIRADLSLIEPVTLWADDKAKPLGTLAKARAMQKKQGHEVVFATNVGTFEAGMVPAGLFVQEGSLLSPPNTTQLGPLHQNVPNRLNTLVIARGNAVQIRPNSSYTFDPTITAAFQTGPMLVQDGVPEETLKRYGQDLKIRTAIGLDNEGKLVIAYSREPISAWELSRFMRLVGLCTVATQLDEHTCKVYAPCWERVAEDGAFAAMLVLRLRKP